MRQNVLTFFGAKQPVAESELTTDCYVVPLRCKTPEQQKFSVILRGIDPVERALLQDAADGKWDKFDLFRAALIVEGERNPNVIREQEKRLDRIVADVKEKLQSSGNLTPQTLTRELFETMHRELLTKDYSLDCTEVGRVLQTGNFNCVSATVLFNCLAEKAGLNVYALEMPGHALSRVKFNGVSMDLETTCPNWFELKNNAERLNATMEKVAPQTAAVNQPLANSINTPPKPIENLEDLSKGLREISPVQLVATIYYNIGVDKHNQNLYAEAAAADIKALYLDPVNETAWGNILVAINNWSLDVIKVKGNERYDVAATLLDYGLALDPQYENFKTNQLHVFYYWIRGLALKHRFEDARTVFTFADARLPENPQIAKLMASIAGEEQKERNKVAR
ncbi:hypothetical protein FACS189419_08950 [Planctomycetales bacterium]|nr:hypothetical protein FACS189419_08950 [Planctomycetales bacterium]